MRSSVILHLCFVLPLLTQSSIAADPEVKEIRAVHRHGQTFVTWKDASSGEAGVRYRYRLLRSEKPISDDNVAEAELAIDGILNNSAKLFGHAFYQRDRVDPAKPYATIQERGKPLPPWSGVVVRTVQQPGKSYYAVVATNLEGKPLSKIVAGQSATPEPLEELVAPIQPIKLYDSKHRGQYSPQTSVTGQKNLPLRVELHGSQGQGGPGSDYGDYYLYFATPQMGWRDGLPGVFTVQERRDKAGNYLLLETRDAIEQADGSGANETFWFGYLCTPQRAAHREPRVYTFTERRLDWIIDWVVKKYGADPQRVTCGGGSMGAWGSTTYAFRHPELFAAVYPNRPRTRQRGLPRVGPDLPAGAPIHMEDGRTLFYDRMDMVRFAAEHSEDLPVYLWCNGRHDGFASWQEQIDMVDALSKAHHGFAFAWNNGDHSSGAKPMEQIRKWYPPEVFARDRSYPAFSHSSIDQKLGNGDPADGDLEGGINLGFRWEVLADEQKKWSIRLSNELATGDMTVDVTPRRCQKFRPAKGVNLGWKTSTGQSGKATVDDFGLVTLAGLKLTKGEKVEVTVSP